MCGDQFEPGVERKGSEKGMRPAIFSKIARARVFQKADAGFANTTNPGEHLVLFAKELLVQGNWRFSADGAAFYDDQRHMKAPVKGHVARRLNNHPSRLALHASFDLHQMSGNFCHGPTLGIGALVPVRASDCVRRAQISFARVIQPVDNCLNVDQISPRATQSNGGTTGLFERVRQLKYLGLLEGRAENLQADWKLPADFTAGN